MCTVVSEGWRHEDDLGYTSVIWDQALQSFTPTTTSSIVMTFYRGGLPTLHHNDFKEALFRAPCWRLWFLCKMFESTVEGLSWISVQIFMFPSGWILICGDPQSFLSAILSGENVICPIFWLMTKRSTSACTMEKFVEGFPPETLFKQTIVKL